ncbi:hypothetical protein VTL71DRAFT_11165 [Oculimacula yallundae]|uniref:Uncharacterized protein n=1 Tax=Oculimacula yallundae TaxID=86028 RepID=A0ABR4CV77_9HELO
MRTYCFRSSISLNSAGKSTNDNTLPPSSMMQFSLPILAASVGLLATSATAAVPDCNIAVYVRDDKFAYTPS